jgi:hypothetical protein
MKRVELHLLPPGVGPPVSRTRGPAKTFLQQIDLSMAPPLVVKHGERE